MKCLFKILNILSLTFAPFISYSQYISVVSGNNPVCVGSSVTLGAFWSPTAGASVQWRLYPQGTIIASSATTITYTATSTGSTQIQALSGGFGGSTALFTIIKQSPSQGYSSPPSGPDSVCTGQTRSYTASATNNLNRHLWSYPSGWSGPASTTSPTNSSIVCGPNAVSGNITVRPENACGIGPAVSRFVTVVNQSSLLSQPTGNSTISIGSNTSFSVTASPGSVFQWQILGSNGNWNNLSNVPPYSGVNSSTLSITNAPSSLDSSRYRVVLTSCSNVFSNTVLLLVKPGVGLPQVNSCIGDTVSIPVSNLAINGVANAIMTLQYNPDSLVYVGFSNLNPVLNGMSITGGGGNVVMNWNAATNQNISAGTLLQLRFRVNGNSNLTWDTVVTPCEFNDENLNLVPQTYVSGSVTQNTKRFTWNRNICEGQSFSLSGQSYTTSGTFQGRRCGMGGACDTLITLNLNVIPRQTILPAVTRCSNQPYPFNGLSLTSSGTYYDTLNNSLGCDSILQLNLTVNRSFNQNQNIVVCSGTSFAFGGQNLTTSGNYSHTYSTVNGCDSLVNLNLSVVGGNQVSIQASSNTNGFCPGGGIRLSLNSNLYANSIYRWKLNGNLLAGASSDTLYATQAGDYQLEIEVLPACTLVSNSLTITVLNCNRITGDLRYDNTNQTPLAGVPVHLKTLLGNIVASDTTDSAGVYDMTGYDNGNYLLDASVNYTWGGVTSTDALLVTRVFNALNSISALRLKSGDVNMNNSTNGSDALLISRRATGVINSFVAGNFTNNLPSVNALGNPLGSNLRVLATGDVNGSYAALPTAPVLVLDTVIAGFGSGTATVRFTSSGSGVFERGICWGTSPNPTVSGNKMVVGSGGYGFTQVFSGSMVGNLHYARAYARTSSGIFYSNEMTFRPGIGYTYAGGIVFYIDASGQHGLVCAPVDQGNFQWGCQGTNIAGTSTAFGTGQANTNLILAGCSQRPISASVCDNLVLNGYSDWYLPSRDELQLMYSNLRNPGIGGFTNTWYWSSSQATSSQNAPYNAWSMNFANGNVYDIGSGSYKTANCQVRAVRAF
jgi:hypothetical protein